jgi:hypothetical protein
MSPADSSTSVLLPYMEDHHAPEQVAWPRNPEDETTGLPQADDSFGWLPPSHRHPHPQQAPTMTTNAGSTVDRPYSNMGMDVAVGQVSQSAPAGSSFGLYPLPSQPANSQTAYPPTQPYFSPKQYARPQASYLHEGAVPGGAMVELGLLTESEINPGWFSFMQDWDYGKWQDCVGWGTSLM